MCCRAGFYGTAISLYFVCFIIFLYRYLSINVTCIKWGVFLKTFVQAAGIFLLVILTIVFMANKFSSTTSDTELQTTLDNAVEHALYVAMSNNMYTIEDQDQLAADVMHELFSTCNVKADYTIAFNVIDIENGLVDVQVTQSFKSSNILKSDVVCRRTIILDSPADDIS